MERMLKRKTFQIVASLNSMDWGHEDTLALIWAGMLHEYPDIEIEDVEKIWDATPFEDRMKAFADVTHAVSKAAGLPVDEKAYQKAMDEWLRIQKAESK